MSRTCILNDTYVIIEQIHSKNVLPGLKFGIGPSMVQIVRQILLVCDINYIYRDGERVPDKPNGWQIIQNLIGWRILTTQPTGESQFIRQYVGFRNVVTPLPRIGNLLPESWTSDISYQRRLYTTTVAIRFRMSSCTATLPSISRCRVGNRLLPRLPSITKQQVDWSFPTSLSGKGLSKTLSLDHESTARSSRHTASQRGASLRAERSIWQAVPTPNYTYNHNLFTSKP